MESPHGASELTPVAWELAPVESQVLLMLILLELAWAHLDAQMDAMCATERQLVLGHKLELSLAVFVAHGRRTLRKGHPPPA